MPATLLVLLGSCLLAAAPAPKKAAAPAAKAAPAKAAPKAEDAPLPPEAQKRIALIEPALPKGIARPALKKVMDAIEEDLRGQGYEIVPSAQVTALHLKRKLKVPSCNDAPDCLAKIGKVAGAGYVANLSITAAGKNFGIKLTLVDTADATMVSNNMGFVQKPQDAALVEAIRKQTPRAGAALGKRIAEKQAVAAAAPVEPKPAEPVAQPEPKPAEPQPVEPKPVEAKPEPIKVEPAVAQPEPKPMISVLPSTGEAPPPAAAQPAAAPAAEVRTSSGGVGAAPWVLLGGGAVVVGVGYGAFGSLAKSAASNYKEGLDAKNNQSKAKTMAAVADVCGGVGGALMVTGAILAIYRAATDSPALPVSPSIAVSPGGAGVALSGSF